MEPEVNPIYRDRFRILLILYYFSKEYRNEYAPDLVRLFKGEIKIQKIDFLLRNPDYLAYELMELMTEDDTLNRQDIHSRADNYSSERREIADGGRVDILYQSDSITVPIELKKTDKPISPDSIRENYLSQAQTYVYPYDQLGFFMLLDLNKKEKETPINDIRDLFGVMHLEPIHKLNQAFPDYIVTIIIPGNKIIPSERSHYNA